MLAGYQKRCATRSDINEHLPVLYEYTKKCSTVVECGVRSIVSSYAFALGLKGTENNKYYLVDPSACGDMPMFLKLCKDEGIDATFWNKSDLECTLVNTDLLFIDTWHVYGQLKRELARWNVAVNKYIIMHDTTIDEWHGETLRVGWDAHQQSKQHKMPVSEITRGLWPAISEFLADHPEWVVEKRLTNNNGLTILARVPSTQ